MSQVNTWIFNSLTLEDGYGCLRYWLDGMMNEFDNPHVLGIHFGKGVFCSDRPSIIKFCSNGHKSSTVVF